MRRVALAFWLYFAAALTLHAQTLTTLVNFNGTNGQSPDATLIQATDGNLYGTTQVGGLHNLGTVFKTTPQGTLSTLYSFNGSDGSLPYSSLIQATDGNFYGTTSGGGDFTCRQGCGTVFRITAAGALTLLYGFHATDGKWPNAGLVQASDGNFYGTTVNGGVHDVGTIFKITPQGSLTTLHSFCSVGGPKCTDGYEPFGGLTQADNGSLYGTTCTGGVNGFGTIFRITPAGSLTTLYSFKNTDGSCPSGSLVQASDGNFFGTTQNGGGANRYGTVFKMSPDGALTTLHVFSGADGMFPMAVMQASDGNFYGTTNEGGDFQDGTVFEITPNGELTSLHSFHGDEGLNPSAGLVQATDGNFYGATTAGGTNSDGTLFRLSGLFWPLSVNKSGDGLVSSGDGHVYCGALCSYNYPNGAKLRLTANPVAGGTLGAWAGCDNVQGNVCLVTVSGGRDVSATFTQISINLTSLVLQPSTVKGGTISIATVTLAQAAPPGGFGIGMSSDHPQVVQPPSLVIVPEGKTSISFAVRTTPVRVKTVANVTATANSSHANATLTVNTK